MNLVIPPLVFYILGAALVVGGGVRALTLGRRNPARELADDDPKKHTARKRHLTFGVIWILMGLFLIASTAGVLRSRSESTRVVPVSPIGGEGGLSGMGPTLRLSPDRPTALRPPAAPP